MHGRRAKKKSVRSCPIGMNCEQRLAAGRLSLLKDIGIASTSRTLSLFTPGVKVTNIWNRSCYGNRGTGAWVWRVHCAVSKARQYALVFPYETKIRRSCMLEEQEIIAESTTIVQMRAPPALRCSASRQISATAKSDG